jgi:hypothetical protein
VQPPERAPIDALLVLRRVPRQETNP